jgi:hypothetical protein
MMRPGARIGHIYRIADPACDHRMAFTGLPLDRFWQ